MKAITCSQCGALIKKISLRDKFACCDFCGAKILIQENKESIVEISDKKEEKTLSPWEQYRENHKKIQERANQFNYQIDDEPQTKNLSFLGPIIIILIAVIPIIFIAINARNHSTPKEPEKKPFVVNSNIRIPRFPTPTPYPQINYEVKAEWSGSDDLEHLENPQIDMSKLPTTNYAELKKTVFKNRVVRVRVTIETTGEVSTAEIISGHPILAEATVNAAKKNLFNSRSKPTTRVLTYYFRLIE
ncbi:hypothetical protein BH10ACI1_BH10ACI1_03710 [soil metagenome]